MHTTAPWNFSWIVPGVLAGTSCPSSAQELWFLKQQGISHLVTLSPEYLPPETHEFPPGLKWMCIPIEEFEAPSLEDMKQFVRLCQKVKEQNQAVAIHCRAGRGRTGTMAAVYLVHFHDKSPEAAISTIRLARPGSVETYVQERAVSTYRDYLRTQSP